MQMEMNLDDQAAILELATELSTIKVKLAKATATLEWLHNFFNDKVVKDMVSKTLVELK